MSLSPLTQPLTPREPGPSCPRFVLCPLVVYYGVAVGTAYGLSVLQYKRQFSDQHVESELPRYMYVLPYQILAIACAVLASLNSLHHLCQHWWYQPSTASPKGPVLLILSMVPVYAVCSMSALLLSNGHWKLPMLLNAFREFYEALVLMAFLQFIAEFWGGTLRLAKLLDTDELVLGNVFPFVVEQLKKRFSCCCCCRCQLEDVRVFPLPRAPGSEYVGWTYMGVSQYALVMIFFVLATVAVWALQVFGHWDADCFVKIAMILKLIKGVSNLWAMYNLLILFEYLREAQHAAERMNSIRPISKFICIKAIVLFSLWQEFIFSFLAHKNLLPVFRGELDWKDQEETAQAAVNFLVCLEMVAFAQWHRYGYPFTEDWSGATGAVRSIYVTQGVNNYRPNRLARCGPGKLIDEVLFLLFRRVPKQHECVGMLAKCRRDRRQLTKEKEERLRDLFLSFELDSDKLVSTAQVRHILVGSGLVRNVREAREAMKEVDTNKDQRLSIDEFLGLQQVQTFTVSAA